MRTEETRSANEGLKPCSESDVACELSRVDFVISKSTRGKHRLLSSPRNDCDICDFNNTQEDVDARFLSVEAFFFLHQERSTIVQQCASSAKTFVFAFGFFSSRTVYDCSTTPRLECQNLCVCIR